MRKFFKILTVGIISMCFACLFFSGCSFGETGNNNDGLIDKGKEIVKMEVVNIPEEGIVIGEFNQAGVKLKVTYSDNNEEFIPVFEEMLPEEGKVLLETVGVHDISLVYKGVAVEFSVRVKQPGYVITFVNLNNVTVKTVVYYPDAEGEIEKPTAEEMEVEGYRFLGTYDNDFENVTSDITVKGEYVKVWKVKFYNANNEAISEQTIDNGSSAEEPTAEEMEVEGYRFLGTYDNDFENVTSDITVKGEYVKVWKVKFYNANNEAISEQTIDNGSSAEEPTDFIDGNICKLLFWDTDFSEVTSDLEIYGLFSNHVISDWIIGTDATCTQTGYKYKECRICHYKTAESAIPAKGHVYQTVLVREARCNQDGEIKYVCECGDSYSITTHAEHYMKVTERVEATCTQDGYIKYSCDNCDDEDYVEIMPQGHNYVMEETDNELVYTCSRCGDSYSERKQGIASTGNVLLIQDRIPWDIDNAVALLRRLENNGYINGWSITTTDKFNEVDLSLFEVIYIANDQTTATYNKLNNLNDQLTSYARNGGVVVYGACDHGWAGGNIAYPIIGGVSRTTYYSRYNYIIDSNHPVVTGVLTDGVGINDYLLEGTYCSHSAFTVNTLPLGYNAILQDSRGIPTLVEYSVGNGYVIASGLTWEFYYTRSFKGDTTYSKNVYDDLIVYAMGLANLCDHVLIQQEVVAPTCVAKGYTVYVCELCEKTVYGDYTDMVAHSPVLIEKVDATCTENGIIKHYKCSECGGLFADAECKTEIADIVILAGHKFSNVLSYDSNCHWYSAICGHTQEEVRIPHNMSSWYTAVSEETGEEIEKRECSCGYTETREPIRGSITGRVYASNANGNALLSGATVKLEGNNVVYTTVTNENGVYVFENLKFGDYEITVTKTGYISANQNCSLNMQNKQNGDIYLVIDGSNLPGYATGKVKDASTASGISGITVYVRNGLNNTNGDIIQTLTTGSNGYYETNELPAGNYTFEFVDNRVNVVKKYGSASINVAIIANATVSDKDASLINVSDMNTQTMKIVLTWGANPSDLDSHLKIDSNKNDSVDYHVYFGEKTSGGASLDVDDTSSYGPETITVDLKSNTYYKYYVYNYSGGGSNVLSNSGATVKVYVGVSQTPVYEFTVPNGSGRTWNIFGYDADTGEFTIYNSIS